MRFNSFHIENSSTMSFHFFFSLSRIGGTAGTRISSALCVSKWKQKSCLPTTIDTYAHMYDYYLEKKETTLIRNHEHENEIIAKFDFRIRA